VGSLAGQDIQTTVDAQLAAYYLEHYLSGHRSNPVYDALLDAELGALSVDPSDHEALRRLSQRFSTDLATIYFVARLYNSPDNRRAQETFHAYLKRLKGSQASAVPRIDNVYRSYLMAFVPGYAYKKDLTTGADFARQREIMARQGFQTVLVETDELGRVEENARIVADAIDRMTRQHDNIILVSASKGGPETALALSERLSEEARRHVRAWISVGGLLRGSPYADWALRWPRRWFAKIAFAFQGLRPNVIENLSTEVRRPAFARLQIPADVLTLQYVGVPLSGHISKAARGRYEALRELGPNDGLTLLADELLPGGIVVTDVGFDHYYRDPAIDLKTVALAFVVFEELERRAKGNGLQPRPNRRCKGRPERIRAIGPPVNTRSLASQLGLFSGDVSGLYFG
jgi:hypothetical protein